MKGNPRVLELLNEALKAELTAINQYWLHYRMLDNWGVKKLAELERHESIDEMKHFQALGSLRIGESVEEILKADLAAEHEAVDMYRNGVAECEKLRDYVSRDLFAEVLKDEEGHVDVLETQFEMIRQMGLHNYIQLQSEAVEG
jgi:bacterioferritin